MSGNYQDTEENKQIETWEDFGLNLRSYIEENEKQLTRDSYDVILGFSRGGTILAFAFGCMLKDYLHEYSDPHKASVRPIPRGLTCKRDSPCFVMDHPASNNEIRDIKNYLEDDLKSFAKNNNKSKINVLIMDDNITGAKRIYFLERELSKMNCVNSYKTITYVRHPKFLCIETIRKYPEGKDFFTMPWHKAHEKKELDLATDEVDIFKMRFFIELNNKFDLSDIIAKLKKDYVVEHKGTGYIIMNGASLFLLKETSGPDKNYIELNVLQNSFYPPNQCLQTKNSDGNTKTFGELSFCDSTADKTMGVCLACSCLNCNKRLLDKILTVVESQTILIKLKTNKNNNINLKPVIYNWFKSAISNIKLDIEYE